MAEYQELKDLAEELVLAVSNDDVDLGVGKISGIEYEVVVAKNSGEDGSEDKFINEKIEGMNNSDDTERVARDPKKE